MKKVLLLLALLGLATPAAAQNPFSLINFGSTAVDTNGGNKSAGTLRVTLATDGTNPTTVFKVDLSGTSANGTAILVTGTGGTFPVTGTFWQATQPVSGTFWQATQPVSGTVTANAGTGNFTVAQATGTNLHIVCDSGCSSSTAPADEATFTFGTTPHSPVGGVFQTTATSNALTTGQMGAFQVTANRALFTNLRNAAGTEVGTSTTPLSVTLANTGANATAVKVDNSAVTQPVSGTFFQATQPVSLADGTDATLGAKADAKSTATDTTAVSIMSVLKEISAMEQAPASRAVTNAGTFAVQATLQTQTDTVMVGGVNIKEINGVATSMNTGSPDTGTIRVIPADGVLDCAIVSAASTNATNCKGSAGTLVGYELFNTTTTAYYIRTYNLATTPTCSSATGWIRSIPIPPAGAAGQVGGAILPVGPGVAYGTGLGYCITGGSTSTDNTNAAVGIFGVLKYR